LTNVGPNDLIDKLQGTSIFLRGLPSNTDLQDLAKAHVLETAIRQNVVTSSDFTSEDDLAALIHCFRHGWLHADHIHSDEIGYVFASPLHRWFMEAKLLDKSASFEATDILAFTTDVIRSFSRQILSAERTIGPGCVQRAPEAQYQDEFYRCCRERSNRGLLTFPEFGTAKGRVDFYIPTKRWGVELLRDGDRLAQHAGRFSQTGIYQQTLALSDYIILDFRKTLPKVAHCMCICFSWSLFAHSVFPLTQQAFRNYTTLCSPTTSGVYPFWTVRWRMFVKTLRCCKIVELGVAVEVW
jgi:hypothetical protein